MEFTAREIDGDIMVVDAEGGIDASNAAHFSDSVLAMVAGGFNRLIIDCSGLSHIGSVGIAVLLRINARARRAGGDVKLCSVGGMPMQVLTMMRLDRVFEIYPDLGQARSAFVVTA